MVNSSLHYNCTKQNTIPYLCGLKCKACTFPAQQCKGLRLKTRPLKSNKKINIFSTVLIEIISNDGKYHTTEKLAQR